MDSCNQLEKCLCCDGENLRTILDLGNQSPANNYNVTEKFPLRLNVCLDCSHAQLSHSVDPDILFRDYPYMSGVSKTMRDYYKAFAEMVRNARPDSKTVFEIACNDGAQLDEFKKLGFVTSGIDPAGNFHEQNIRKDHNVRCGYFPQHAPVETFDLVIAQNVFAHVPDPHSFLQGCKKIMHKDSLLFIQTSQANMLDNHQADTIYHEHISFFNKRSIIKLFSRCDMEIVEHRFVPEIHGGSDLWVLKKLPEISILDYSDFSNRCYKFAGEFRKTVEDLQIQGKRIICYGAAAKMINLIRFTGIKPDRFLDDTPTKIGQIIEGVEIESGAAAKFYTENSVIIPVWNFFDEIKAKVEKDHPGKFKFLKYIPQIKIL